MMSGKYVAYGIDNDFDLFCVNESGMTIACYNGKKGIWRYPENPFPVYHDVSPVTEKSMLRRTEGRYPDANKYDEINSPLKRMLDRKCQQLFDNAYAREYARVEALHPDWSPYEITDEMPEVPHYDYACFVKEVRELLLKRIDKKHLTAYLWQQENAMPCYYILGVRPEDVVELMLL